MIAKEVMKTMIDQDVTLKKLAEMTGYTYNHLSKVIHGHVNSEKVKKIIAFALRKNFDELWGEGSKGDK